MDAPAGDVIDPKVLSGVVEDEQDELDQDQEDSDLLAGYGGADAADLDDDGGEVDENGDPLPLAPVSRKPNVDLEEDPEDPEVIAAATTEAAEAALAAQDQAAKDAGGTVEPETKKEYEKRIRKMEGTIGTLISKVDNLMGHGADEPGEPAVKKPGKQDALEALQSSEKFAAMKEEFPEWAEAMEEQMGVLATFTPSKADMASLVNGAVNEAKEEMRVEFKHPGWLDTVKSPEFASWAEDQDEETLALAASPKSSDAIAFLDKYEESKRPKTPESDPADDQNQDEQDRSRRSRQRLNRAASPTRGNRAPERKSSPSEEEDLSAGYYGNR